MRYIIILFIWIGLISCNPETTDNSDSSTVKRLAAESNSAEILLNKFPVVRKSNEPLHFYNQEAEIEESLFDSIIQSSLSASMLEDIGFQVETPKHQLSIQFPLGENHIACVLNTNESWYKKQSLLLFNKQNKTYEKVIPLSQFYGGDGGQMVNESWLYLENDETYLYQKESSHALVISGTSGEPEEFLSESSSLSVWIGNSFEKTVMKDSIQLSNQFKLKWEW